MYYPPQSQGQPHSNPGQPLSHPGNPQSHPGNPLSNPGNPRSNPGQPFSNPASNPGQPFSNPASNPGQPFSNPASNPGQPFSNPGQPFSNPGQPFSNPASNPGQPFSNPASNPGQPFSNPASNPGQPFSNPGQPFSNPGNPRSNPGQPFSNSPQTTPFPLEPQRQPFLNPPRPAVPPRHQKRLFVILGSALGITVLLSGVAFALVSWHAANSNKQPRVSTSSTPQAQSTLAVPTPTPAIQPTPTATPTPQSQDLAGRIDSLLTSRVDAQTFSGSVLIARNGQIILNKGYSMADWGSQKPNDAGTRFYLGSVSKEFTAMSILILQERGKLHVQDSVCLYINPCPQYWHPVTIHNVLTHTSGIPENAPVQFSGASPAAWIYSFNPFRLNFTPSSLFDYCSTCYQVLAYIVEQASGQPFAQFVQENILTPVQMQSTGYSKTNYYAQADHATGYATWQNPAVTLSWNVSPAWSFLFGSGLLYSTVGDLYRWDQALYTHTLVSQQTLDAAFTAYSPVSLFAGSGYGYGWFIAKSPVAGHRLIWHDGVIDGFRTYIGRYIDDHVTIIFLSNLATLDSPSLAHSIEQLIFS